MKFDKDIKYTIIIDHNEELGKKVLQKLFELDFDWKIARYTNELIHLNAYSFELNYTGDGIISMCNEHVDKVHDKCKHINPTELLCQIPENLFKM